MSKAELKRLVRDLKGSKNAKAEASNVVRGIDFKIKEILVKSKSMGVLQVNYNRLAQELRAD